MGLRRQYMDVLGGRLRHADGPGVLDLGLRWLGSACSRFAGRPLVGPALGTLVVTYRCDLRCRVCDLPTRARLRRGAGARELTTSGLRSVLREMRAIKTAGVGITGGEPMLRSDTEALLGYGTRLGLYMHLNTDGFRVSDSAVDLIASGVRSINISLDGPDASTHDAARRRAGAFDRVMAAFDALRRARGPRAEPRLAAVTVLTAANIDRIDAVAQVARDAGADRLGVIPVHDFGQGETAPDGERVAAGLATLRRLHADGFLDNSLAYIDLVPRALDGKESPLVCYAPHTSVVVDCYGDVYPCFPLMERDEPVGRIPLTRLWRSAAYARTRDRLSGCRACLWNCHTEMNLALPQRGRRTG